MTTEHVGTRGFLATSLVTAVAHVGIAGPDLDVAIAWYHDHLGMILVHEEINTIAKFLDKRGPGIQQIAYRVSDLDAMSERLHDQGVRLVYETARRGTAHSRINFIHPKDAGGVLIELVEHSSE